MKQTTIARATFATSLLSEATTDSQLGTRQSNIKDNNQEEEDEEEDMNFGDTTNNGGTHVNEDEIPAAVKVNKHWDKPVQSESNFKIF